MTESPWRSTSTRLQEPREFKIRSIGFSRYMQKEELSNHSINDPTLLKRKENANDCTTSTWQERNKTTETFLPVNNYDSEKGNNLKATKNTTTPLTRKQIGGSTDSRGETCRHLRQDRGPTCKKLRHHRQHGTKPSGRQTIGILSILQALTTGEFFSELGQDTVAWRKTSSQPTRCVNSTPTNTARTELHGMITFHHANTRGSRAARLRIAHLCVLRTIVIHVSCLVPCRTWHWPQAQVLSHPFHPLLLSFRRSHPHKRILWISTHVYPAMFHGRVADQHKSHLLHIMVAHIEELEILVASEIRARRLQGKGKITPKRSEKYVPSCGWNSKIVWRRWSPRIVYDWINL